MSPGVCMSSNASGDTRQADAAPSLRPRQPTRILHPLTPPLLALVEIWVGFLSQHTPSSRNTIDAAEVPTSPRRYSPFPPLRSVTSFFAPQTPSSNHRFLVTPTWRIVSGRYRGILFRGSAGSRKNHRGRRVFGEAREGRGAVPAGG